jgi:predicted TIM-barrel fold metal-dependent hydrolase
MRTNGYDWDKRDTAPGSEELAATTRVFYDYCIEHFGPERCLFESNYPVDKVSCSYHVLWNTFKRIASGCSAAEKAHLFHDTATRVYRINAT